MKQLCALCLVFLLLATAVARPRLNERARRDERAFLLSAALVGELDRWVERADFWRLVTRAEYIQTKIEISEKESRAAEAWLCGGNSICLTTGLREYLTDAELQAAIAHEIGHIVIPRSLNGPAQLWETQCDLLAVALLRDADIVKDMLYAVDRVCPNCRDAEHLAPYERIALIEYCADQPLEKINRLDALRQGSFALQLTDLTLSPTRRLP